MATPRKTGPIGHTHRALDLALGSAWTLLREAATDPAAFQTLIDQAFGSAGTGRAGFVAATEALRQHLLSGGDLGLRFTLLNGSTMGGARAAFGQGDIYVNTDWARTASQPDLIQVMIEEIGHAIDQRLNGPLDSAGDEGRLFASLLTGASLTDDQRAAILAENDHGRLTIHGRDLVVEFSIDAGTVTGAADNLLNAAELSGGLQITGVSKLFGTGTSFLVGVFTSSSATAPIFWQKSAASVLTTDSATASMTISSANLNGYQGPIFLRIYQGTSSGAGQSAAITGSTVAFPASSSFSVNSALNGTALTTSNATSASGQRTLGTYTIDTVVNAPSAPDLDAGSDSGASSTDNLTNDTTPTVTGTGAEAGATVRLYGTDGTTLLGTTTASGAGAWTITATALAQGAHTLTAKQTDAAGNVSSASGALVVTIDTTAPTNTPSAPDLAAASDGGVSDTDNLTNDTTPTVTGTGATAGATVILYDTNGTTVLGSAIADGAGAWTITSSALSAGAHTLTVREADAAGNTGPASSGLVVTIDASAAAPGTPDLAGVSDSGASATDNITNDDTPKFLGSGAEAGATVTLYDTDGTTTLGSATADGAGAWTITSTALADGVHAITVRQTDKAGNTSNASTALSVTIDTTAAPPSAPDLASASDTGSSDSDNVTKNTAPTVTGTADAGATVTLFGSDGTTVLGTTTANGAGVWTITTPVLAEGLHTLTAKQTDLAGNSGKASAIGSIVIDTVAPGASGAPELPASADKGVSDTDDLTADRTPTLIGAGAEAGATITLYDTDGTTVLATTSADAEGAWTATSTKLSVGPHTLTVVQTDLAGNKGVASPALVITIDLPPDSPILAPASDTGASSSDGVTKDDTPTVTGVDAPAGATITLYGSDGVTLLGTTTADSLGNWSITTPTLTNGAHTLTAKENGGPASLGLDVVIDTVTTPLPTPDLPAIADTGVSSTDNITNIPTPTLLGTGAEPGATITLYDTGGVESVGSTTADGAGNWSITTSTLSEGAHILTPRQTDLAGNVGIGKQGLVVTIDTVAPAAPNAPVLAATSDTGTSSNDQLTSRTTPTFTGGGAMAGVTVTLYDTDGVTALGSTIATNQGKWSITTLTMANGAHTLTVRQTDKAGNVSAASESLSVTIDSVAPPAPTAPDLAATSDSGASSSDNLTNLTTPSIKGTGAEIGAKITLYDGTTGIATGAVNASGGWTIVTPVLADGTHNLTVKQADKAGNTSGFSNTLVVTIDTVAAALTAPDLAATSDTGASNTDDVTSVTKPLLTGKGAEALATVTLYDTDQTTVLATTTADAAGLWQVTTATLSAGAHTITTKQTDRAGNVSALSAGLTITVDTTAPATPAAPMLAPASDTGSLNDDGLTSKTTPVFTGTGAEAGASVTLFGTDRVTALGTAIVDGSGAWSITTTALATGTHAITARLTDKAGNISGFSAVKTITIDTAIATLAAPDLIVTSDTGVSGTDNLTSLTTPTLGGTAAEAGATITLYRANGTVTLGSTTADAAGNWTITAEPLTAGAHTITARQTDTAGNLSAASAGLLVTIDTTAPAALNTPDLAAASDTGPSNTDNITSKTTPTITGTGGEIGNLVTLFDTDGVTVLGTGSVDGLGNWSIVASTLAPGDHTLTARQTDKAGNLGAPSAGLTVTVDTTVGQTSAPDLMIESDSGVSTTDNLTNKTTPTLTGTGADPGATVTLYDTNGITVVGVGVADAGGAWSIKTNTLTAGAHTLTAKQTDKAGNVGIASAPLVVTIDATAAAPTALDLVTASDTGPSATDNKTADATPTIAGAGAEAGATITLYDTNGITVLGSTIANSAGTWMVTASTLSLGAHTLTARMEDRAGNLSSPSTGLVVTIETGSGLPAPDLATASDSGSSASDDLTNVATPTITGTGATAGQTVTLYDTNGSTVLGSAVADGAGAWSIVTAALAHGPHALMAKQGAVAISSELVVMIDRIVATPAAPDLDTAFDTGVSSADNITSATTQTFRGENAEAGATITLYASDGTTVLGTTAADGAGMWSIGGIALAEGAHTLSVSQTDTAGNVSAKSATLAVTVDTVVTAPSAPDLASASDTGLSTADNLTSKSAPTVTGTGAEAGASVILYDTDGVTILGSAIADAGGAWSIASATLSNGTHTLTARQTDKAGNVSAASSGLAVTIDTAPPAPLTNLDLAAASDTGVSDADNLTNATTPMITGTGAEAGATVTLFDTNGTTVLGTAIASGTGTWSIVSATLSAGAHTLTAKQTDGAGNVSAVSPALVVTIDTVAATTGTPDLATGSDSGASSSDNLTNRTTPTITGTGAEAGATVTLYDTNGTTVLGSATASTLGVWAITTSTLAAGAHTMTAKQTDKAGNVSAASSALVVTIDTTVTTPGTPDLASASDTGTSSTDNLTKLTTPTFSGTGGEAGATVTLYDTDGTSVLGTGTVDAGGAWTVVSKAMANGAHRVTARQTDKAGNTGNASAALTMTVDSVAGATSAPDLIAASDTGTASNDNVTANPTPTLAGTKAEAGATVTLYDTDGTTVLGSTTADAAGAWSIVTTTLTDGAHTLTAKQTDAAGNTSAASASLVVSIDTTAPTAPGAPDLAAASDTGASNTDNITKNTSLSLSGTGAEANTLVTVFDTDGVTKVGSALSNGSGAWSLMTVALAAGNHTLTARQTDKADNLGAASTALEVTIDTSAGLIPQAPDLAAGSDSGDSSSDNVTNDTTPTLTGSGADKGATITLTDTAAFASTVLGTATVDANGKWSITSPSLADGQHVLTVTQTDLAGNVSQSSSSLTVTIDTTAAAPSILTVTPTTIGGTAPEGRAVTILGSGIPLVDGPIIGGTAWLAKFALSAGLHSLTAITTDLAGNTSAASAALSVDMGTAGADTLAGTAGADLMVGGAGNDTYMVDHAGDIVQEETGGGTDTVNASVGYTLPNGAAIEFLYAVDPGSAGLALTGNANPNAIIGGAGADTLTGGGSGDTLTGGAGADRFVFTALSDSNAIGSDLITDFSGAAGDLLDLQALDANASLAGDQAFTFIGTAAFSGAAGQLRYETTGGNTRVMGDVTGDSVEDFSFLLTGTPTLNSGHFVL